jgi:hypothetical protein
LYFLEHLDGFTAPNIPFYQSELDFQALMALGRKNAVLTASRRINSGDITECIW